MLDVIESKDLKNMFYYSYNELKKHMQEINDLNVFPVPDGDTGTNMLLTLEAAVKEINNNEIDQSNAGKVAKALANGSLMGARGNSGVILSQILRGFAQSIDAKATINPVEFSLALKAGADKAYKAVMKPVEGTMLTVAMEASVSSLATAQKKKNFQTMLSTTVDKTSESLANTPNLLPVLKEAGVVDAGGKGLLYIYKGFLNYFLAGKISVELLTTDDVIEKELGIRNYSGETIELAYCTELLLKGDNLDDEKLKEELTDMGDCLLVVGGPNLLKIHIHTNMPGTVLNLCTNKGTLHKIKIDNMVDQHQETHINNDDNVTKAQGNIEKETGIIVVSIGKGFDEIFKSLGADVIISGGQTMNPSANDFVEKINAMNFYNYILLPNNKNIIMSAEQAAQLVDKPIKVINTHSLPEGLAALLEFNKDKDVETNHKLMNNACKQIKTGEVTKAVRKTSYNGISINQGDYIGIFEGEVLVAGEELEDTAFNLIKKVVAEDDEVVSIYYGAEFEKQGAEKIAEDLEEFFSFLEIEVYEGGQPLYPLIISVE